MRQPPRPSPRTKSSARASHAPPAQISQRLDAAVGGGVVHGVGMLHRGRYRPLQPRRGGGRVPPQPVGALKGDNKPARPGGNGLGIRPRRRQRDALGVQHREQVGLRQAGQAAFAAVGESRRQPVPAVANGHQAGAVGTDPQA